MEKLDKLQEHLGNGDSLKDYDKATLVATYQEVSESKNGIYSSYKVERQ